MKIGLVGKFEKMHDEEYIARSFEHLGYQVLRIDQTQHDMLIHKAILTEKPDLLLFTKWEAGPMARSAVLRAKEWGMKTVCWVFDLYIGYEREYRIPNAWYFKADYVFTTDGGDNERWAKFGIKHQCVRQGIYHKECKMLDGNKNGIVFVGSENPFYPDRTAIMRRLEKDYQDFKWYGRKDTDMIRGMGLNDLFSRKKIVVGDSVYAPHYWSNRVVETLGRGGFLIHRDVPGLKEEYPYLVTYNGDYEDLKKKIDYYLEHDDEREEIVRKNFEWVRDRYTMDKKCQELLSKIQ